MKVRNRNIYRFNISQSVETKSLAYGGREITLVIKKNSLKAFIQAEKIN